MMLPPTALPSALRVEVPGPRHVVPKHRQAELVRRSGRARLFGRLPGLRSTATDPCRHELASDLESRS